MKIDVPNRCKSSARKAFLQQFTIALTECDHDAVMTSVSDDITWHIPGEGDITGKSDLARQLALREKIKVKKLTLHNIITHGQQAAAHGELHLENGDFIAFCDIYTFKSGQAPAVQSICSYMVCL